MIFLLQAMPEGGAVEIPPEIAVSAPEILGKFVLMALAAGLPVLLPWALRGAQSPAARRFRAGAVYALMPAIVVGAGLASFVTGLSLTRIKFGGLSEFWPLPVAILCFALGLEILGGLCGMAAGAGDSP